MSRFFVACLRGNNVDPPVDTLAGGRFAAISNSSKTRLRFRLEISGVNNLRGAYLVLDDPGENGRIIVTLYRTSVNDITINDALIDGTITQNRLRGPLEGQNISRLVDLIKRCRVYVVVTTTQNRWGQIAGQIQKRCREDFLNLW